MTTATTTTRTLACPTHHKLPLPGLLERLRAQLRRRRDIRHVLQLSDHLLRDIGFDDSDPRELRRALRQGHR